MLTILTLIISLSTYHKYKTITQKKIAIYSINKHSAYDFINGNQHVLISDSTLMDKNLDYQLKNSRTKWGIDNLQTIPVNDTIINNLVSIIDNFLFFEDMTIYIADGSENYYPTETKLPLDLVIISGKKNIDIRQLNSIFDFNKVVIDSSVPPWNQKTIKKMCLEENISCFNVNKEGALVIEL